MDLVRPRCAWREQFGQRHERGAGIALHCDIGGVVASDLIRVDVDLDELLLRREPEPLEERMPTARTTSAASITGRMREFTHIVPTESG